MEAEENEKQKILAKIKEILAEKLLVNPKEITLETTLEDLGSDSLDLIEIKFELEKNFNIKEILKDFKTVGDIQQYIEKNRPI